MAGARWRSRIRSLASAGDRRALLLLIRTGERDASVLDRSDERSPLTQHNTAGPSWQLIGEQLQVLPNTLIRAEEGSGMQHSGVA